MRNENMREFNILRCQLCGKELTDEVPRCYHRDIEGNLRLADSAIEQW